MLNKGKPYNVKESVKTALIIALFFIIFMLIPTITGQAERIKELEASQAKALKICEDKCKGQSPKPRRSGRKPKNAYVRYGGTND
jgi:hypothetical protein